MFEYIYEEVGNLIVDDEVFLSIIEIIIDNALSQDSNRDEFLERLLQSKISHKVFSSLSFDEKLTMIESILAMKGT